MRNDRDRIKCIISETIVALCNSGLDFSRELSVEGLLGITLDGRDILLVNINEVIKSGVKTLPSRNVKKTGDIGNEASFSEVATSSDPTTEIYEVETIHHSTPCIYSTDHEQSSRADSCHKITSVNQTDRVVSRTTQIKTDPEDVVIISLNDDEEENDSLCGDTKLESLPQVGFWMENIQNTNANSTQQLVSEVTASHSCKMHGSLSNIHTSDQFCNKVLKVESTTDTPGSLTRGDQDNYLGTVMTPVSQCVNVSSQQVPTSAMNLQQHIQRFDTSYQMKQYRRYSQAALVDAVAAVQNHSMTVNRASRVFNVPRSTIQIRLLKLSGKKTWGSRSEKQPGGTLQNMDRETGSESRGSQEAMMIGESGIQLQSDSNLPAHSDTG